MKLRSSLFAAIFLAATAILSYHSHSKPIIFIAAFFCAIEAGFQIADACMERVEWDMDDHRFLNALLSIKFPEHK